MGVITPPPGLLSSLGNPPQIYFHTRPWKINWFQCGQQRVLTDTTEFPQLCVDTTQGQQKSISFSLSYLHTNTCKLPPLPKANSYSRASNRVAFVARLSACVSLPHHISRDRKRMRERGSAATLSFLLGYKAAHHWPARVVVRGLWDTMEAFVPCHPAIRHSHTGGV